MSEERAYVTLFELARWLLPTLLVVLGVVLFFVYHGAAPALGGGPLTP
ncbi:MAG TPA: hypothetical protein VFS07_05975 [Gemmatimonadales bacterium]|jgi:hypothetical protein|nr:hypothetical protein [Gemmatimonadales bacterium]